MQNTIETMREDQEQVRSQQISSLEEKLEHVIYQLSNAKLTGPARKKLLAKAEKIEQELENWSNMYPSEIEGRQFDLEVSYLEAYQEMELS